MAIQLGRHRRRQQQCIFCGASPVHKEHVLAKWIRKVTPYSKGPVNWSFTNDPLTRRHRKHRLFTEQARVVCQDECNGGWMSRIEDAAKPVLTPMIQGRDTVLTPADQDVLGRWAAKTALISCYLQPQIPVPAGYPEAFYATKEPPAWPWMTLVWIAKHGMPGRDLQAESFRRGPSRVGWTPRVLNVPAPPIRAGELNGYNVTISVCCFAFKVVVFELPRLKNFVIDFDHDFPGIHLVWPRIHDAVTRWPPGRALDDVGLSALHSAKPSLRLIEPGHPLAMPFPRVHTLKTDA